MYAEQQAAQQAQAGGNAQSSQPGSGEAPKDDGNVVDAEFTEVKDKKTG
jgi:molecular chaperone DnaK